eukprot:TRINITY_DN312_c0_g1_i12.p2 TRINITY_DN312_c0_g1~~TRINITY_DN312_c0_g1_i12.p2  ORF type:complete len:575 (+),score=55.75 TRINITY_DN312_c0_g1_i12:7938-9662(+)
MPSVARSATRQARPASAATSKPRRRPAHRTPPRRGVSTPQVLESSSESSSTSPAPESSRRPNEQRPVASVMPRGGVSATSILRSGTQGNAMQDSDSDVAEDDHAKGTSPSMSDTEWPESDEDYDPLQDAPDGQAARVLDGNPHTMEQCVTGRGILGPLAAGLFDEDLRRSPVRGAQAVAALWSALCMTPAGRKQKLALDAERLVLAPNARLPRHGGPLARPGDLVGLFDIDTIHVFSPTLFCIFASENSFLKSAGSIEMSKHISAQHSTPRPLKLRIPMEEIRVDTNSSSGDGDPPSEQEDAGQLPEDGVHRRARRDPLSGCARTYTMVPLSALVPVVKVAEAGSADGLPFTVAAIFSDTKTPLHKLHEAVRCGKRGKASRRLKDTSVELCALRNALVSAGNETRTALKRRCQQALRELAALPLPQAQALDDMPETEGSVVDRRTALNTIIAGSLSDLHTIDLQVPSSVGALSAQTLSPAGGRGIALHGLSVFAVRRFLDAYDRAIIDALGAGWGMFMAFCKGPQNLLPRTTEIMSALFDSGSGAPFVEQTPAQLQLAADMARRVEQELRRQLA